MKSVIRTSVAAAALIASAALVSAQTEIKGEQGGAEQQAPNQIQPELQAPQQVRQHEETKGLSGAKQQAQEPGGLNEKSENRYEGLQNGADRFGATPTQSQAEPRLTPDQKGRGMEGQNVQPGTEGRSSYSLSREQETQIREHVINERSARADRGDFALTVGTIVPRHLHFITLPHSVATLVPRLRGYKFIIVEDEIVIVDPRTYRIVAVIRT
jgi:hypothetical protein